MNSKLIIVTVVIAIAVAFMAFISSQKVSSGTSTSETAVTSEESSIVDDQVNSISEEQLKAVSAEDPTFLSDMQSSIAADASIFYYE